MEIKIVIPTFRRAGRVSTLAIAPFAALCVTDSEHDLYASNYRDVEIIVHPDSVRGLSAKRQWIYEKYGDVVMLDDDLAEVCRNYAFSRSILSPDEIRDLIDWTANIAKLAGCYLFGWSILPKPQYYAGHKPISMRGFVNGCAMGLLASPDLFFNPECVAVEDYWISALNAHFHRKAFIDERFTFIQSDTFINRGGQSAHRDMTTEARDLQLLKRNFGTAIEWVKSSDGHGKGKNKTAPRNPYKKRLRLPF